MNTDSAMRAERRPIGDGSSWGRGVVTVRVIDLEMPFLSMLIFMVKWAIAAIPAVLILAVVYAVSIGFLAALVGGITGHHR
jgi:hypothetical protein